MSRRKVTTRIDPLRLERALNAYSTASFECGEWNRNDSDESWDTVYAREQRAMARVWRVVGIERPAKVAPEVSAPVASCEGR